MLFLITQTHSPELCPKDDGGSKTLYDANAEGVNVIAIYGAYSEHVIYYVVEASDAKAIEKFLFPGFKRCVSKITPVIQGTLVK